MPQTKEGAKKAKQTLYDKYGKDYFSKMGALGGAAGNTGGFYANRELARKAGRLGGQRSKRRKSIDK